MKHKQFPAFRTSKGAASMDSTSLSKMGIKKWKKASKGSKGSSPKSRSPLPSASSVVTAADEKDRTETKGEKTDTTLPTGPPNTKATSMISSQQSSRLLTKTESEKKPSIDKEATVLKVMTEYLSMPKKDFSKLSRK